MAYNGYVANHVLPATPSGSTGPGSRWPGAWREEPRIDRLLPPPGSVLVITDRAATGELLGLILEEEGLCVDVARPGPAVLARLAHQPPAVVIVALTPLDHGAEALTATLVAAERAAVPSVLLSTDPRAVAQARAAGRGHALAMPFDLDDLLAIVRQALPQAALLRSAALAVSQLILK